MFEAATIHAVEPPTDYRRKIVTVDQLVRLVADFRPPRAAASKTVVLCHGCFDIVHPGHIRYLEFAGTQGDILVVSITADAAVEKGNERPYIPQELRAENLAVLELVDYVLVDQNPTATSLIRALRPDVYVKGQEYATSNDPRFLAERQEVESYGGRVIFSSGDVVFSSSRLGDAVVQGNGLAEQRLRLACKRHDIDHARLAVFLNRMRDRRVLVFGDSFVQRYVLCDATDIAGESPMMSLTELSRKDYLGGAAAAAMQAAALGAEVLFVTGLGDDVLSQWAMRTLVEAGVEVRALRPRPDLSVKTRFLVDEHKLFKIDRTAVQPLDSMTERKAMDMLTAEASRTDAAVVYDSGHGTVTPGVLRHFAGPLRRKVPVIVGGTGERRGDPRGLKCFDLLCTSERKLRTAMNDFGGSLSTLAYGMLQETQAKQTIVTLAKRGLVAFDRRSHDPRSPAWTDRLRSEHLPAFAHRVADTLGCSEAMVAVAALGLTGGASLMQTAYLAAAAAAIEVGVPGIVPIDGDELRRWMMIRPELNEARQKDGSLEPERTSRMRGEYAVGAV